MYSIQNVWMAVFKDEIGEKILTYEVLQQTLSGPRWLIVPAMTVDQDRLNELIPQWKESARNLGVEIYIVCMERLKRDIISDYMVIGNFPNGGGA